MSRTLTQATGPAHSRILGIGGVRGELVVTNDEIAWELKEAGELRAMIVAAIIKAQSNSARGGTTL